MFLVVVLLVAIVIVPFVVNYLNIKTNTRKIWNNRSNK